MSVHRNTHRVFEVLLLVLVMFVWASASTVTKAALTQVPPLLFALLRFAVASAVLLPFAFAGRKRAAQLSGSEWGTIAAMGFCGITLFYVSYNLALYYASASQVVILQSAIPAVTAVFAVFLLKEHPSGKRILGIGLSLLGILLVVLAAAPGGDASNPLLGSVLMLGAVAGWALYTIFAKRLAAAPQLSITAYSTAIGTALLIPLVLVELNTVSLMVITVRDWLGILYLGVISTAGGYLLYNRSLAHLDASQAAAFLNLLPVFGVTIAVIFLGEAVAVWQLGGGVLVLLGIWLAA
jgi:drug/metabolite transporter (DMT)-like permease